jgi:hypothetical protein
MKGGTMKYLFFILLLVAVAITAGCSSENEKTIVTPTLTPTPTVIPMVTTIPQMTVESTPSQTYKNADIVLSLNTYPKYGFKMDYPSDWTYSPLRTGAKAGYNFAMTGESVFSPNSYVRVKVDDLSGAGVYWYPIHKWANNTVKSMTEAYCLDGAGNPIDWDYCQQPQITMYHPVLISNEPVIIPGAFESRKLVFRSFDDRYYGQRTVYLMHSGRMEGYNYTVPDHPEVAVKVDGPVWDYGVGGQGYAIEFFTSTDQMNSTSGIFDHMINSFQITST